jgi:creatinine amidohydrolase
MTRKHVLAHMSFREFEQRIPENPVILLPLGSQEEHGPTSPMGDFMLTEALAARVAERAEAIAAPTTPFGYADYFRPIPGGIQLRAETFCLMLRDYADNFLDHGLNRLVIFNGHSGNAPLIDRVTREIRRDTGVIVPSINVWRLHTPEVWSEAYGSAGAKAFGHGAEPLASVYSHVVPALVRPDLVETPANGKRFLGFETAGFGAVRFRGIEIAMPLDVTDLTDNGIVSGNPAIASAESGRRIADHIVEVSAAFVREFAAARGKA